MISRHFIFIFIFFITSCSHHKSSSSVKRNPASWHSCFEDLNAIIFHKQLSNGLGHIDFHLAGSLNDLEDGYGSESLFTIQGRLSNNDINLNNNRLSELLNNDPFVESNKVTRLDRDQAQTVYDDMMSTPCVRNDGPYQRPGVEVGYCFGRAITSHMHAIRRGVEPKSMKKIWVVGPMRGDWGHHVAHMIRADDGSWWVIDNVTGLVKVDQWIAALKGFKDTSKELMFFVTEASRFGPQKNFTYNTVNLFNVQNRQFEVFQKDNDYYIGFFKDLFQHLDETPVLETFTPTY